MCEIADFIRPFVFSAGVVGIYGKRVFHLDLCFGSCTQHGGQEDWDDNGMTWIDMSVDLMVQRLYILEYQCEWLVGYSR